MAILCAVARVSLRRRALRGIHSPRERRLLHLLYCGSDSFSVDTLSRLLANNEIAPRFSRLSVLAPPPKPRFANSKYLVDGKLLEFAKKHGISYHLAPLQSMRDWECPPEITADVAFVVSFPYFVPAFFINRFKTGIVNAHPSLLPRWRGPAPIHHTILENDRMSGVSIITLDTRRFDAGSVLLQEKFEIQSTENIYFKPLAKRLSSLSGDLLYKCLQDLPSFLSAAVTQSAESITYSRKISKADALIYWTDCTARQVWAKWRAFGHRIPFKAVVNGSRRMQIVEMRPPVNEIPFSKHHVACDLAPGTGVFFAPEEAIYLRCCESTDLAGSSENFKYLVITKIRPESRIAMSARDFALGFRIPLDKLVFQFSGIEKKYILQSAVKASV